MKLVHPTPRPASVLLLTSLPGPDRKRLPAEYRFRITYRNPAVGEAGCVMTWDVTGGRLPYQIALERLDDGGLLWHCSCADAVYRGELDAGHVCKHVRGLRSGLPDLGPAARRAVA